MAIDNPNLIYTIIRSRKKFQALRDFTLESGQEEIERQNQLRKEGNGAELSRQTSIDSLRSPTAARTPSLGNVPEENSAFAIGSDDEESDAENTSPPPQTTSPVQSPPQEAHGSHPVVHRSPRQLTRLCLRSYGACQRRRGARCPLGKPLSRVRTASQALQA